MNPMTMTEYWLLYDNETIDHAATRKAWGKYDRANSILPLLDAIHLRVMLCGTRKEIEYYHRRVL